MTSNQLQEGPLTGQFHLRSTLEKLKEAGLIEAHGTGKGRTYTLSAKVYQATGDHAEYIRQSGFDRLQQEQMVLKYVETHGKIKRGDVIGLCRVSKDQAARLLSRLVERNELQMHGKKRGAYYERTHNL